MNLLPWSRVCDIAEADLAALAEWAAGSDRHWPNHADLTKPQRVWDLPKALTDPIVSRVLEEFGPLVAAKDLCLSRIRPRTSHPMHVDSEPATFVTRIHVPLVTNEKCWFVWELDGQVVHFATGSAYSFDTQERHAFGNGGRTARIHFCFDLWRIF